MGALDDLYKYSGAKSLVDLGTGHPLNALNDSGPAQLYNGAKSVFGATPTPKGPPGALTGPPPDVSRLHMGPDGRAVDPVTGQVYVADGKGGFTAQQTPNLAQQSDVATGRATGFYNQVPGYDKREAAAFGREGTLADTLTRLASGQGPSVAGAQTAITLDQAQKQQLAQAAGASGSNAALARMSAMGNTGALAANANQTGALARTAEEANALNALGNVTGNMEQQSAGLAGQRINAGTALSGLGMQGMSEQEQLQFAAEKAKADAAAADKTRYMNAITAGVNAYGKLG